MTDAASGSPAPAAGSPLTSFVDTSSTWHVAYFGTNGHVNLLTCCVTYQDLTQTTGAQPAVANGSLTSVLASAGSNYHLFYLGTDGDIHELYEYGSTPTWGTGDDTASSGAPAPPSASPLTSYVDSSSIWHVAYVGANQNVYMIDCCADGRQKTDLTIASSGGIVAASNTQLTSFFDSFGQHVINEGASGLIYQLYDGGSWQDQSLFSTSGVILYDSGTVSLDVGGFTATACYGHSSNSACTGQTNDFPSDIAAALASALNVPSSPVNAVASGASISLTWKEPGPNSSVVAALTSAPDNPTDFPNGSFSSAETTFSGGTGSSLTSPSSTFYTYDALGDLLNVTEGAQTRTYNYNSLGQLTSSCIPETNNVCTTYTYNGFGAISTKTDPRNIITTYGYDQWNHINSISYSDGVTASLSYTYGGSGAANNGAGRLISTTDGTGSKAYRYDAMGRTTNITQVLGGNTYTTTYAYINGELSNITYPSGTSVTYTPDPIGRLSSVTVNGTNVFGIGSYNAASQPLTTSFGNGMAGTYGYNNQLQLNNLVYGSSSTPLLNLTYNYGDALDNGQIQSIIDNLVPSRSTVYGYDALGRLQQAQTFDQTDPNTWNLVFAYDRYGNRLSETPNGGAGNMPSNSVMVNATTNQISSGGYAYDANGNMTNDTFNVYGFDAANHIVSVSAPSVTTPTVTYSYDSSGHRVSKNGVGRYIYSGGQVIAEYAAEATASSPSEEYIYAGSRRVATLAGGAFTYHYWDHLSDRVDADGSGNVLRSYGSFPFGETWYETGTANKWKFTTYENDTESGLNYAMARHHSPRLGRFMSTDPLSGSIASPQSLNRYTYVADDPINGTDPSGAVLDGGDCFWTGNCMGPGGLGGPGGSPLFGGGSGAGVPEPDPFGGPQCDPGDSCDPGPSDPGDDGDQQQPHPNPNYPGNDPDGICPLLNSDGNCYNALQALLSIGDLGCVSLAEGGWPCSPADQIPVIDVASNPIPIDPGMTADDWFNLLSVFNGPTITDPNELIADTQMANYESSHQTGPLEPDQVIPGTQMTIPGTQCVQGCHFVDQYPSELINGDPGCALAGIALALGVAAVPESAPYWVFYIAGNAAGAGATYYACR